MSDRESELDVPCGKCKQRAEECGNENNADEARAGTGLKTNMGYPGN